MRKTIAEIHEFKRHGRKISMLTAYDYMSAKALESAGIPLILVGDSLGQVILGYDSTIPVTMEQMIHHTQAVVRGTSSSLVVSDMPFLTYHTDHSQAIGNAGRLLQEGGAQAVKLEGGSKIASIVSKLTECGIPVMGHIGLLPQSINLANGFKVRGKTAHEAASLVTDALDLEAAGAFALVLELIPEPLARLITDSVRIPTIGIGSGGGCDGQIQVLNDFLGFNSDFIPKHAKPYVNLNEIIKDAIQRYIVEVESGDFPTTRQSLSMDESLLDGIKGKRISHSTVQRVDEA